MNLKEILAISGKGGLFKFISQGRGGIIVESFDDKSRSLVHASAKVSALEDIAIFTETEEVPLKNVFLKIFEKESGREAISHKADNNQLKAYFETILPDYDRERVYVSDMKKVVLWYNILLGLDMIRPDEPEAAKAVEEAAPAKESTTDENAPAKPKAKSTKAAAPKEDGGKKAPAKKTGGPKA